MKKPVDYVEEYLRKKLGRPCTAAEYIGANGLAPEDYEAERISMAPRRLRRAIERLAEEARRDKEQEEEAERLALSQQNSTLGWIN